MYFFRNICYATDRVHQKVGRGYTQYRFIIGKICINCNDLVLWLHGERSHRESRCGGCWNMARSIRSLIHDQLGNLQNLSESLCKSKMCLFRKTKKGFKDNICQPRMNDFDTKKLSAWSKQKLQLSIERISDTDKSISTLGECLICKPT